MNADPISDIDASSWDGSDTPDAHLDDSSIASPIQPIQPRSHRPGQGSASTLRRDLNLRALHFAATHRLLHDTTRGGSPSVVFGPEDTPAGPRHGNFFTPSYCAILANPAWSARLAKAHTARRRAWPRCDWRWCELDAASSSDALLMNIFCYPGVLDDPKDPRLRALLGVSAQAQPEFGYHPRIPLTNGRFDRTEIDLRLGTLLVEAKLTESSLQQARPALLERYRDLPLAFDPESLFAHPKVPGYQLIRGVLAALAEPSTPAASFCVLADQRRPDLLEEWYAVLRTVLPGHLRCRLQMLTWQEIAAVLPTPLQNFLAEKYGILPV
jgi:hypothetical protein